jgi:hypothetical protein
MHPVQERTDADEVAPATSNKRSTPTFARAPRTKWLKMVWFFASGESSDVSGIELFVDRGLTQI